MDIQQIRHPSVRPLTFELCIELSNFEIDSSADLGNNVVNSSHDEVMP